MKLSFIVNCIIEYIIKWNKMKKNKTIKNVFFLMLFGLKKYQFLLHLGEFSVFLSFRDHIKTAIISTLTALQAKSIKST